MTHRTQLLAKLIREGIYVVDEQAVAEAIVLRSVVCRSMPQITFRSDVRSTVRSFRRAEHSRSFRLANERRRTPQH